MGDRTWVHLTIRIEDIPVASKLMGFDGEQSQITDNEEYGWATLTHHLDLVFTQFNECNNGDFGYEFELQQAGIPYNKDWGQGDNYGPGSQYCRYTETGELVLREVYDDEINPNIDELIKRIDEPDKLRQYILDHKADNTPLPWDDQETNRKRFLTRQLITP